MVSSCVAPAYSMLFLFLPASVGGFLARAPMFRVRRIASAQRVNAAVPALASVNRAGCACIGPSIQKKLRPVMN